ncbi:MAG: aspartate-semialdehyde dehydrogenase [Gemmatimonadota bacterium]|nr:aspartate-semialdehyde dehydrogenase [Gemmatimonadota bacterium]
MSIPVAILGATGAVGQTFVRLLRAHPWFHVAEVAASERSAGKTYAEATHWLDDTLPANIASMQVKRCSPAFVSSPIVFSALDSSVAGGIEVAFAMDGRTVCSNAKNHRMDSDVPLLIPEINAHHLQVLGSQRRRAGWNGTLVTNANCAATVAALALAPIHQIFGVSKLFVATMQAVSGAGYPGVPSLDILGNVIPYITDEEGKIETEIAKLLGEVSAAAIVPAHLHVTAHANRVPVLHGHTVCMSIGLRTAASPEQVTAALADWTGRAEAASLPSRPLHPIVIHEAADRPQPMRDCNVGNGMSVSVGRIRRDELLDVRLVAMGSNMIRGAAGGAVLNAELLVEQGYVTVP